MSRRRGRRLAGAFGALCLALATMGGPAMAAAAPPYGAGQHSGDYGLHWLLDGYSSPEYPAVTCEYGGDGELERMRIRRPVVFGDDRGPGTDSQTVGWKAVIQSVTDLGGGMYDYTPYGETSRTKLTASDRYPADFLPKVFDFPENVEVNLGYRVVYRLSWWYPTAGVLDGQAAHFPKWYRRTQGSAFDLAADWCASDDTVGSDGLLPYGYGTHDGAYGLHWILDHVGPNPEYPAVTCAYDDSYQLDAIKVRRPIVFARDRGPGVDSQPVGWKAVVQIADAPPPGIAAPAGVEPAWSFYRESPVQKDGASDRYWADFLARTIDVPASLANKQLRVVYRMFWYAPDGHTIRGRANDRPYWYRITWAGASSWASESCRSELPTG